MSILGYFTPPATPTPVIKMDELCALLGRHRQTVYRWVSEGELPPPLRTPSGRLIGWNRDDIMTFLKHQT